MSLHPVNPEPIPLSIARIIESVTTGEYDIPEFQRSFVWSDHQVRDLLDSLIRGYPIGAFLIWDLTEYEISRSTPKEGRRKEWIIDGQQRITALCILWRRKPYWISNEEWERLLRRNKVKVNVRTLRVSLEYPAIRNDPKWVYPHELLSIPSNGINMYVKKLMSKLNVPQELYIDEFARIRDNIERIRDALVNTKIPIIKVSMSLEDVVEVFNRINSAGTKVKTADITLAYIAAYNPTWVREKFLKYLERLDEEGYGIEPVQLLRTLIAVGEDKAIIRYTSKEFIKNTGGVLDRAFDRLKSSLNMLIRMFQEVGIFNFNLIYAKNTIIPIIYFYSRFPFEFNFNKAFHYFLLALAEGRYSGSAETQLQEDINKIKVASSFEEAIESLHKTIRPIKITPGLIKESVHYRSIGRFLKLLLYLVVYRNGARDWFTGIRLGWLSNKEINRDFTIQVHHFFPQSLLKRIGIPSEKRDTIANIAFVNPGTNKRLRDAPNVYIKKYKIELEELRKQLIPTEERLWDLRFYDEFLDIRSKLIAEELRNYLMTLYPEYYMHG
ncbi:MAG: hypothetical protein DRJ32_05085 [Thermoprotei archaeon]|nr:MAG: hypothetical protein DRJ32_05085 [Thermoprotei archaeon]